MYKWTHFNNNFFYNINNTLMVRPSHGQLEMPKYYNVEQI